MKKKQFILLVFLTFGLFFGFKAGTISIDYFKAKNIGDRVILEWKSISEDGLKSYVIERKRETQTDYEEVKTFDPKGNNSVYQYDDIGLYKTTSEKINYRLKINSEENSFYYMNTSISYTATAVRRTWGSIKAMFK